jgi:hypothetical protein
VVPLPGAAAGVERVTILAVVGEVEASPVPAADVERSVGPECQVPDRVGGVLLAPVLDQYLLAAGHLVGVEVDLQAREAPADHAAVSAVAPGGEGQGSESMPTVPQRGAGWVLPSWWSYV